MNAAVRGDSKTQNCAGKPMRERFYTFSLNQIATRNVHRGMPIHVLHIRLNPRGAVWPLQTQSPDGEHTHTQNKCSQMFMTKRARGMFYSPKCRTLFTYVHIHIRVANHTKSPRSRAAATTTMTTCISFALAGAHANDANYYYYYNSIRLSRAPCKTQTSISNTISSSTCSG